MKGCQFSWNRYYKEGDDFGFVRRSSAGDRGEKGGAKRYRVSCVMRDDVVTAVKRGRKRSGVGGVPGAWYEDTLCKLLLCVPAFQKSF